MVGVILFAVIVCVGLLVVYGLRHPWFWLACAVVVVVLLPCVVLMAIVGSSWSV